MRKSSWLHYSMGEGKMHTLALLSHGGVLADAISFADFLSQYSCVQIDHVAVSQEQDVEIGTFSQGAYDNIGFYARLKLRESVSEKLFDLDVYAPADSMFDTDQQVKTEVGDAIAAEYSAYTRLTFTFERGALCGCSI